MNKNSHISGLLLSFLVCLFLVSCEKDYTDTGRGLLYAAGLIAGFLVDRAIAKEKGSESLLGILAGFFTLGVFGLAAVYIPADLAQSLGLLTVIVGSIIMFVFIFKQTKK